MQAAMTNERERDIWMERRGFRMVMNLIVGGYAEGFDREAEYQFMRRDWVAPRMFRLSDQSRYLNIWGLKYRPAQDMTDFLSLPTRP